LAMVLYHAKDLEQAFDHQQKATIINERVLGLDHYDTARSYEALAMFCQEIGKSKQAVIYAKRSLYLTRLLCGPNHPDVAATFTNTAKMLLDMQQNRHAIYHLQEALKCYELLLGPNHPQTAEIYHAIALCYSHLGQYKEALAYERKNFAILHAHTSDTDARVIESNTSLKLFTAKAVQMQIESKKAQVNVTQLATSKLEQLRSGKGTLLSERPAGEKGVGKTNVPSTPGLNNGSGGTIPMGSRPLHEVISFINNLEVDSTSGNHKTQRSFFERNEKNAARYQVGGSNHNGENGIEHRKRVKKRFPEPSVHLK